MAQYQEDRGQLEAQFKQFRQAREQLVADVRGRLDEMHGKLNGKTGRLAEAGVASRSFSVVTPNRTPRQASS